MTFANFALDPSLLQGIAQMGFAQPTPIQAQAIPPALMGRDVLASAMTGSGKTAAFLLPVLQKLLSRPRGSNRALILTPTRELAQQIEKHLSQLAAHTSLRSTTIIGGVAMGPQVRAFRSGIEVLIATPGRLLDHARQPYVRFSDIEILVLDEADQMLEMGFLPDIRRILALLPTERQTLFFSATMPGPIATLAKEILQDPLTIRQEGRSAPAKGISQSVYRVTQDLKAKLLLDLIEHKAMQQVIVFTRTKHRANRLAEFLTKAQIRCERIHGNRSQGQRTQALEGFKSGKHQVLVATDVAARGIDVAGLGHVVNFDVPQAPEDYIHRVGRTARGERTGEAITLVAPDEESKLRAIERAIDQRLQRVTLSDFDYGAAPAEPLEIPLQERIAAIRATKARAKATQNQSDPRRSGSKPTPTKGSSEQAGDPNAHRSRERPARPTRNSRPVGHP